MMFNRRSNGSIGGQGSAPSAGGLFSQVQKFADNLRKTNTNPQTLLDELVRSGRYTNEQVEKAKAMAKFFAQNLKL